MYVPYEFLTPWLLNFNKHQKRKKMRENLDSRTSMYLKG